MRRTTVNLALDLAAMVGMLSLTLTGIVLHWLLPPGSGGGRHQASRVLWGLSRHDWGAIHFWLAVVVMVVLTAHVIRHWSWLYGTIRLGTGTDPGRQTCSIRRPSWIGAAVLAGVIVLMGLFLVLARSAVMLPH